MTHMSLQPEIRPPMQLLPKGRKSADPEPKMRVGSVIPQIFLFSEWYNRKRKSKSSYLCLMQANHRTSDLPLYMIINPDVSKPCCRTRRKLCLLHRLCSSDVIGPFISHLPSHLLSSEYCMPCIVEGPAPFTKGGSVLGGSVAFCGK